MAQNEFQIKAIGDPRLAVYATSSQPVWLWSADGAHVLWCNAVAADLLGASNPVALAARSFGPADPHRRQIAQLSGRLPTDGATRLERLRGFGARFGQLTTCACSRLEFADGLVGVLIVVADPAARQMPLVERLRRLVEGVEQPIAAFARDGMFVGASDVARPLLGLRNLSEAGLDAARGEALREGRVETPVGIGHVVLQRVGTGADIGLVALLAPSPITTPTPTPTPADPPQLTSPSKPAATSHVVEIADLATTPLVEAGLDATPHVEISELLHDVFAETEPETDETFEVAAPPAAPNQLPTQESVLADAAQPFTQDVEVVHSPAAGETTTASDDILSDDARTAALALPESFTQPLRFLWRIDPVHRFSIQSPQFAALVGPAITAAIAKSWIEAAAQWQIDPEGAFARAIATRNAWSNVTLQWPVDGAHLKLAAELSGLPLLDREGQFAGFRGFGICSDLDAMTEMARLRRDEATVPSLPLRPLAADVVTVKPFSPEPAHDDPPDFVAEPITAFQSEFSNQMDTAVDTHINVVPFRPPGEIKPPVLTPVENNAFNEIARRLSQGLDTEPHVDIDAQTHSDKDEATIDDLTADLSGAHVAPTAQPAATPWLAPAETPVRGGLLRDRTLLDLVPVGVLIYRLDRLLYANTEFLSRTGYASLNALTEAGGLDALTVEPGTPSQGSASEAGTPVTIAAAVASADHGERFRSEARLHSIWWDDDAAHALIFSPGRESVASAGAADIKPPQPGEPDVEDFAAIIDAAHDAIFMLDATGRVVSCNRATEAMLGMAGNTISGRPLADLFVGSAERGVRDDTDQLKAGATQSAPRDVLLRRGDGTTLEATITVSRTRSDGGVVFATLRDLSQQRKSEVERKQAQQQAERAGSAKADVLARISHEVRMPLSAIIGFAEVMIDGRFGPLGNERYADYMRDIRASGERVVAIIDDMLKLSSIETGKLDLAFSRQSLNEMVEQCVAAMQPQANRERIIIRTSLAHALPPVFADARALRQIALSLIGSSIHLANTGGQVIVSTALSDLGDIVLRVRDTGAGLNDNEVAAAMQPFRTQPPSDASDGVNLSLTKALVEANKARFLIKAAPQSGTLIEVTFSQAAGAT